MSKMRACIVSIALIGAATVPTVNSAKADQVGYASWYALHSRTARGARMNPSAMTAAHRSLPFGTKVLVENLSNGRSAVVTINDRGPFVQGRIIDVSKAAASSLGMLGSGTAKVRVSTTGGSHPVVTRSGRRIAGGSMRNTPKLTRTASSRRRFHGVALASPYESGTSSQRGARATGTVFYNNMYSILGGRPGFMKQTHNGQHGSRRSA
jgi:rare lipoprotein A